MCRLGEAATVTNFRVTDPPISSLEHYYRFWNTQFEKLCQLERFHNFYQNCV